MNVLVVGGAGYVGSHVARRLAHAGHDVWVYDNLSAGHRSACDAQKLVVGELSDHEKLTAVLSKHAIEAVLHFAAFCYVGESVSLPAKYYQNNVVGTLALLDAMRQSDVSRLVFSSTTAVYGSPSEIPITEQTPLDPISPYGFTKRVVEHALVDYSRAYGLGSIALRYFNAAGASRDGGIGEDHTPETHLIPLVLQVALGQREKITIFGDEYPTPDGTCVRDYIHVDDLAEAHLKALDAIEPGSFDAINLGSGVGASVMQVVEACREVTGHDIPVDIGLRRPGDPPELIADISKAKHKLSWQPEFTNIREIVETAWKWHQRHPQGYAD